MFTTGVLVCSDSFWVTSGILAPPPTVAITEISDHPILLRCNRLSSSESTKAKGSTSSDSNSALVTRTTERTPGRSTGTSVAVAPDNRSLACRHCSRSTPSCPTAAVAAGSASLTSASTRPNNAWSMRSPEKSATRTVSSIGSNPASASASVMLVPPPPRSMRTTAPRAFRPGLAFSAVNEVTASDTSRGGAPPGERTGFARNAARRTRMVAGVQCAGTAITVCPDPVGPTSASRASTRRSSAR
nr:hypothetical protein [Arthrobacter sp. SLBN-53]